MHRATFSHIWSQLYSAAASFNGWLEYHIWSKSFIQKLGIASLGVMLIVGSTGMGVWWLTPDEVKATTQTFDVASGADDGGWGYGGFSSTAQYNFVGKVGTTEANTFYRFGNIPIPKGSTVSSANLKITANASSSSSSISTTISAGDADNASAPTSQSGAENAVRTSATVSWNTIGSWTTGNQFSSPDISSIVQEVVDRAGWSSGNAIVVYVEDFNSSISNYGFAAMYENVSHAAPQLTVTYTAPASTFDQSSYRFFANQDSTDVGAPLANQDTAAAINSAGQAFRLRTSVHIGNDNLPQGSQDFKLQFAEKGGGSCSVPAGTPSTYTDVALPGVESSNSGAHSPSSAVSDTSISGSSWNNPQNAYTSDNSRAISIGSSATSNYLKTTGYNFSIPANATIAGIEVNVERSSNFSGAADFAVRIVKNDVIGSTDRSLGTNWPSTEAVITYGSSSDLWGESWTPNDINNSNFGFAIAANLQSIYTGYIDHVSITIHYTQVINQPIMYYDNLTPADDAALTGNGNDPGHSGHTTINQTYNEASTFTNSQVQIAAGQDGLWDFSLFDGGAPLNTTYCFRIVQADGTPLDTYSIYPEITLNAPDPPTVTTQAVTAIDQLEATGHGNVTDDGGVAISERGVVWSTTTNPDTTDSKNTTGGTTGSYDVPMTGLSAATTYYVRAYAINSEGTSYGSQVSFTTDPLQAPVVTTQSATDVEERSATGHGTVTDDEGSTITDRGFVWNTTGNPDLSDSSVSTSGTTGPFSASMPNLTPETTYYVKAYATNSIGTSYGSQTSFTTGELSSVQLEGLQLNGIQIY